MDGDGVSLRCVMEEWHNSFLLPPGMEERFGLTERLGWFDLVQRPALRERLNDE